MNDKTKDLELSSDYVDVNTDLIKNIQVFDPTKMCDHATVISTARRRSGKTFSLKRIIAANRKKYDEIYVFSGTIDMPVNKKEFDFIPTENMYNHLDEEVIREILNKQLEMLEFNDARPKKQHIRSNVCIILDDILTDATFRKTNNIVSELFVQGRHSHISLFVLVQSFSGREGIPPLLRKNADYIITFYQHNVNDQKAMAEQFLSIVDVKIGTGYLKAITNEAHTACIIDVNNTSARTYEDYVYKYKAPEKCKDFFIGGNKDRDNYSNIKMPKEERRPVKNKNRLKLNQFNVIKNVAGPSKKKKNRLSNNILVRTSNTEEMNEPAYAL